MRAFSAGEILGADSAVLWRGEFDLESGPMGWRASTTAPIPEEARPGLREGRRYRLQLIGRHPTAVKLDDLEPATGEARFLGVGPAPSVIAINDAATRQIAWRRRRNGR